MPVHNADIAGETEESVFKAVGLPFIPPELRENRREIEAARAGKLPKLVELRDLIGCAQYILDFNNLRFGIGQARHGWLTIALPSMQASSGTRD